MDENRTFPINVRTKRDSATFEVFEGEPILFAGLRAGLDLPYECASGTCGTCQVQSLTDDQHQHLINLYPDAPAAKDLPPGRHLMCQTTCSAAAEFRMFSMLRSQSEDCVKPQHETAEVIAIEQIARDTYRLSLGCPTRMRYLAGQFVMLSVAGVEGARAYSMTASPSFTGGLEFAIRTKPGGAFSNWLLSAHAGQQLRVFGPLGRAVLPKEARNLFAIVGGTGAAGVLSIIEEALARGDLKYTQITLIFGVRRLIDAFHLEKISEWIRAAKGNLEVILALSEHDDSDLTAPPEIEVKSGLVLEIAKQRLEQSLPDKACYFLAGPPVVVDGGSAMLLQQFHIPSTDIRYDRF